MPIGSKKYDYSKFDLDFLIGPCFVLIQTTPLLHGGGILHIDIVSLVSHIEIYVGGFFCIYASRNVVKRGGLRTWESFSALPMRLDSPPILLVSEW